MSEALQLELFNDPPSQRDGRDPASSSGVAANRKRKSDNWLGLITTHRRLLEASQTGWLQPPDGFSFGLGQGSYVSEDLSAGKHVVPVLLAFDMDKLPFMEICKRAARSGCGDSMEHDGRVFPWHAPIPLYATTRLGVTSAEQRLRLLALAEQFGNVSLPLQEVDIVDSKHLSSSPLVEVPRDDAKFIELPSVLDAVQGAMAMAVWGVPRISAWVDLLCLGLNQDFAKISERAMHLGVPWFQFPWSRQDNAIGVEGELTSQKRLWRAAVSCLQSPSAQGKAAFECAEMIAQVASGNCEDCSVAEWLAQTRRLVDSEDQVTWGQLERDQAGLAIQLVLLRPEPVMFKTWAKDLPGLSPVVWWAAAILCGWRTGYRTLDKCFRSDTSAMDEVIATRALAQAFDEDIPAALPSCQTAPIVMQRNCDSFALTWHGTPVLQKKWHFRGKWDNVDLSTSEADNGARDMARSLGWPCLERHLPLSDGRYLARGGGSLLVDGEELVVKGEVRIRLATDTVLDEYVNQHEFRRLLATGYGIVPDVPIEIRKRSEIQPKIVSNPTAAPHGHEVESVPGLIYLPEFISEKEEQDLVGLIDAAEWSDSIKRRVQHYGWRYDYGKRRIDNSSRIGDFPEWANGLARKLEEYGLVKTRPNQVIVNEYREKQGIGKHIDKTDDFAEHIATISLLETWSMVFRYKTEKKFEIPLERRSVAVLGGDARYKWTHEIPRRLNEPRRDGVGKGKRVKRNRRISLTFRTVNTQR